MTKKQVRFLALAIALVVVASVLLFAKITAPPAPSDATNPGILSICYDDTNGAMRLVGQPNGAEPNSCTAGTASSGFTCDPNITSASDPCYCVSGGPQSCSNAEIYVEK